MTIQDNTTRLVTVTPEVTMMVMAAVAAVAAVAALVLNDNDERDDNRDVSNDSIDEDKRFDHDLL